MSTNVNTIRDLADREYKWGFVTEVEEERVPKGLNEDIIRVISAKKNEPEFMLEWRLKAYRHWASLEKAQAEPKWANVKYAPIDYQDIVYYSAPKQKPDREPGVARSGDSADLRKAGDSARGAETAGWCGGGCGVRQRLRGYHVQGEAG